MTTDPFEFDVALSFASEDSALAHELAGLLTSRNIRVFHDEYTGLDPWGKNTVDHLVNLFARKARYCALLISKHYPLTTWREADRTAAKERALREANEYILAFQLDDTEVPGINETTGYRDLRQHSLEAIADLLEQKLVESKKQVGLPSKSHDLRSGNIPPEQT